MVGRMRSLGLKVEYHVYEDDGHGFSRIPNEQAAFNRIIDFLDRHIH